MILDGKSVVSNARGIHDPEPVALALSDIDAGPRHLRTVNIASNAIDHRRIWHRLDIIDIGCREIGFGRLDMRLVYGYIDERKRLLTAIDGVCHQSASVMIVFSSSTS